MLRTGRIVTLHPWEGTVGKPASAHGETSWHPNRDRVPGFREETRVYLLKTRLWGGWSDGAAR